MHKKYALFIWFFLTLLVVGFGLEIQSRMANNSHRAMLTKQVQQRSLDIYSFSNKGAIMGAAIQMGLTSDSVKQRISGAIPPDDHHLKVELESIIQEYKADSVFIVDHNGLVIGSRNRDPKVNSFGVSVKYRPYWAQGINGVANIYPGISMVDYERGLFFATPIYQMHDKKSAVVGVFVVRINAAELDRELRAETLPAALTSPDGLVFASNQTEWIGKLSAPVGKVRQQHLIASQQFAGLFTKIMPSTLPFQLNNDHITLGDKTYAVASATVSWPTQEGNWRVVLLQDTADWLPLWQRALLCISLVAGMFALYSIWQLQRKIKDDAIASIQDNHDIEKKAKQHLLDISNALPLTIFQLKQSNSKRFKYTYVSANSRDVIGLESEQLIVNHRIMEHIVYPEDLSRVLQTFWSAIENKHDFECEHRIFNRTEIRWIKVKAVCNRKEDLNWIWNGYWMDVTSSHEQTDQLREAKEAAESATRTKSMFLANMSHEIRTPMNAVIGLAYLALKTELSAKQRDYLNKIHQAGTSLLGLINDILDASKMEAHQLKLEDIAFNLDDVLANLSMMSSQQANEKGLELLFDVAPDIPRNLMGDPLRLGQILINLVSNAIKFTEKGHVYLQVRQQALDGDQLALQFTIRDTGIGMTQAQADRLFQAFTQADGSITRRFGGTGLGLTIARHLVEQMGGSIEVVSEPDVGSEFHFVIYLAINQNVNEKRRLIPSAINGLRILVVDDNAVACDILLAALQQLPVQAEAVTTADLALARLKQAELAGKPFHLLMTDWQMPTMDGIALAQQARELPKAPRIVLVTAFSHDDIASDARAVGIESFMTKPISRSQVVDCLMHLFSPPQGETIATFEHLLLPQFQHVKVLLAEDNPINQQIAVEMMLACGIQADVANNGKEALSLLCDHAPDYYDLVFMDLQMPLMDGHEATLAIRADARFQPIPIIAMTAHVLAEERERCLNEGMNDHVAKPIDPQQFYKLLTHYLAHKLSGNRAISAPNNSPQLPPLDGLDRAHALARLNGNQTLYAQLLQQFCREQGATPAHIRDLLAQQQHAIAKPLAHGLKGVAANIGATMIAELAAQLERTLENSTDTATPLALTQQLDQALRQLCHQISTFVSQHHCCPHEQHHESLTNEMLAALKDAMRSSDGSALDLFAKLEPALQQVIPMAELQQINHHLQAFDFDLALAQLERFTLVTAPAIPDVQSPD
jgi:two-component system sensor histidine kinase/response regulator